MSWDEYKKYREDLKKKKEKLNIDLPTVGAVKNPSEKYTKDYNTSVWNQVQNIANTNMKLLNKDETNNAKKVNIKNVLNNKEKAWYQKILQQPEAFKNGYQFGDVTKTIGGSIADLGTGLAKGATGLGENIGSLVAGGVAQVADWIGKDEYADRVRRNLAEKKGKVITKKLDSVQEKTFNPYSVIGDTADTGAEGIGQAIALGGVGKVAGSVAKGLTGVTNASKVAQTATGVTTFLSGAGGTLSDSYKKEGVSDWQVWSKAVGSGLIAKKIEELGGLFSNKGADKAITNAITKKMKSSFAKVATKYLSTGLAEGGEEGIEYIAEQALDKAIDIANNLTSKNKATFSKDWDWDEFFTNVFAGTVAGTALGGITNDGQTSIPNLQQDTTIEQNNNTVQQINQENNKVAQNRISEPIDNNQQNLANNQETLYNNNESESGINESINRGTQETDLGRSISESKLFEERKQKQLAQQNYREWEQSIKTKQDTELTYEEQQLKKDIKESQNKDIVFIKEDNGKGFHAGASLDNPNTIYIKTEEAKKFGLKRTSLHETMESNIRFANESNRDIIMSTIDDIVNDASFEKQKIEFWKDQDGNMPNDTAIAKDIICDRLAELNGEKIDYENVLSDEIKNRIDMSIEYFNQELGKASSFSNSREQNTVKENILPTQKQATPPQRQESDEDNQKKYNSYKQNILNRRAEEVNSLISYKNDTIRNIENKINEKQNLLNSKKNQNTKVAINIKSQIERLKSQQAKIENLYNEKIDKVNKKNNKEKIDFETRNTMKQLARENLRAEISPLTEDLTKFKDKKKGILYKRETAQRNIEDIVQDKELAQAINDTIFNPVQKHQAEKTREINNLFSTINDLKLDKNKIYDYVPKETGKSIKIDEATLAQLLIEKKMTKEDLKNKYKMSKEQIEKIDKTANTFSEILDYLYNKMNEEQIKFGYAPIGKIKNYFPHFFENKPDTMLGKIASYFGIDTTNQELPTEIAGITDTFKPGKTWNSNTLKRKTNKTDYDALKAMEKYIIGASDIIYTTEDIQRVREFEREIRYKYSDKGIQEQVDKIYNDKDLTQDAKEIAVKSILENTESELPNFVTWLNDYGNVLANKKSFSDRSMERDLGRNMYSTMKGIEGRIASNTIGGNLSVSLTNFAPLFQSMGTTDFRYVLTGALQTTINDIKGLAGKKDVDFVNNSTFLTNRFGTDTISKQTITQNISNVASVPMNVIDNFTSESIVRAKYLENLDNGMTEEQALDNADKYASRLMADRSKGALPIVFNSKNPLSKLVTMFQVEPNNIVSNYFKDMPKNADGTIDLTYQATKLMVASWAFNTIAMAVRGGNEVLPDPIRWVSYLMKSIFGDDEEEKEKAKKDLAESIIGSIPFASNIAGFGLNDLFGLDSDVGRIPVSNAMPSLTNIVKSIDKDANLEYRKELLTKELAKPLIYLGLPTGGAQLKKTVEGISTVYKGGSYKTDNKGNKKLQFPVENATAKDYIQAGVFGKYSLPVAKQYADRGFKTLSAKQTKTYEEANLPYKEYLEYLDAGLKTIEDKISYIESKDMATEQKWGIYKNDILSNKERDDGSSQLKDAEYITSNGVTKEDYIKIYNKASKNNIDMPTENEYKELKKEEISLDKYMDYKIEVKNKTKKKQEDEKDEGEKLNNKEQIQILIESNYSKKDKTALYEKYIKSKEDSNYDVMRVAGIDIDEILKYKQQDFKSDKKEDGTLQGKTVNKSKQRKVENYLNSMNITENQRLLLYAMNEYTTTSNQKNQLAKYVYDLDLKQKEKLELYSKFQGFTVYKNGTVKW